MEFSQIVYAILGGIVCKVYDDLNDMNILRSEKINEILKGSQWILLTLLSIHDFNFAIVMYIVTFLNSVVNSKEWSEPYESSLLYLYPIFFILSFHTREYLTFFDIIVLVSQCIGSLIEPYIWAEESSYKKLMDRSGGLILNCILLYYASYFNLSKSIIKYTYYFTGYFIISVGFQAYHQILLYKDTEKLDETNTTLV